MTQDMVCLNVPRVLECFLLWLCRIYCKCHLDLVLMYPLLIFYLLVLLTTERGILKSATITVDWLVSSFSTISFCFMCFEVLLDVTFRIVILSWWLDSFNIMCYPSLGFPGGSMVRNPPASAGDTGSIPDLGRSLGEGNGNPFWSSCLEIPMHRGAWRAIVRGVTKSQTWLSDWTVTIPPSTWYFSLLRSLL